MKSKAQKRRGILGSFALAVIAIGALPCALVGCKFADDIAALVIKDVDLAAVKDGSYEGKQNNSPVMADVQVAVSGGKIDTIKVLAHTHGPGHGADAIVDKVLAAQSLMVDSISGATYSSKVMRKAIENALEKGL